jgi:tetratricopeptide (TPR) repeat protein
MAGIPLTKTVFSSVAPVDYTYQQASQCFAIKIRLLLLDDDMMTRLCWVFVFLFFISTDSQAQVFRPRAQGSQASPTAGTAIGAQRATIQSPVAAEPSSGNSVNQQTKSVSQDLLQIYAQTQSVRSEADATGIAKASAKIFTDKSRTAADRDYAASLLAWAMNRRGEIRSDQAAVLVQAGRLEAASKLDEQATDDFAAGVEYGPNKWRHRHNYAISLAMQGDYEKAIVQLNHTIDLNSEYPNAWFNRAELFFQLGELEAAEQDYTAAIELAEDAQYYNSRAHCRFLRQAYETAVSDYRRAVQLEKKSPEYHADLGDACQFLGMWDEAAQAYRDAVASDKGFLRAYQNAAWLMATCPDERLRNSELALAAAKRAFELSPERTAEAVETLAAATAAVGRFDEATRLQEEAIGLMSRSELSAEQQIKEMRQRLSLYQGRQAYLQPQPAISGASSSVTRSASAASAAPSSK